MTKLDWKAKKTAKAHAYRELLRQHIAGSESTPPSKSEAPHGSHRVSISFAESVTSLHWYTLEPSWFALKELLAAAIEVDSKDSYILLPGSLAGGSSPDGTRKLKQNVESLSAIILDFDKGDAPLDKIAARMTELGLESAAYATYSHGKASTKLAWSVTRPDPETGQSVTKASAFQVFVGERLGLAPRPIEPNSVTAEVALAFMVCQSAPNFDPRPNCNLDPFRPWSFRLPSPELWSVSGTA